VANRATIQRFEGRLLHADADTAEHWGRIVARTQSLGRPIEAMDAWIAAHAEQLSVDAGDTQYQ
jgi:predicted nucleic acid-binding protein